MLLRGFPADDLFGPIVFRVAVRHAVRVSDIKNGELAPLIVHGGDSLPLAVHNRMLTLDHPADLAQDRSEFRPWIQRRRRLMLRFPFCDLFADRFGTHVPSFFDRVPTCPECFRFIPFDVWDDQVRSFCVWNVFSHHPNLLGMSYLLLLFDCKDVVTDAFSIGRRVQAAIRNAAPSKMPRIPPIIDAPPSCSFATIRRPKAENPKAKPSKLIVVDIFSSRFCVLILNSGCRFGCGGGSLLSG